MIGGFSSDEQRVMQRAATLQFKPDICASGGDTFNADLCHHRRHR